MSKTTNASTFDPSMMLAAARDAMLKLNPLGLSKNPVIFVTEVVAAFVTLLWLRDLVLSAGEPWFSGQIAAWLWFTVIFANFAEAIAEGRGKAQAEALRRTRTDTLAKRLIMPETHERLYSKVSALQLVPGDLVLVEAGDLIPADGEVVEGIASVNEFGDHRRIRPGHPRVGRRPFGGDGRHDGAVRLAPRQDHGRARQHLHRPHDCVG